MIFDGSVAFRKIKKNQYAFIPGFVYTSKAYIVTFKEKIALNSIIDLYIQYTLKVMAACSLLLLKHVYLGILVSSFAVLIGYIRYRRKVKKIIGNRKKQPCPKQTYLGHTNRLRKRYSWKEIFQSYGGIAIFTYASYELYSHYLEKENVGFLIAALLLSILMLLALVHMWVIIVLKIKNRALEDKNII